MAAQGAASGRRGRPPQVTEARRINVILTLHMGEDDDLLAWFDGIPTGQRAPYVKVALRQGGAAFQTEMPVDEEGLDDDAFDAFLDAF